MSGPVSDSELVEFLARICHNVNRAFSQAFDTPVQPVWGDAPECQKDNARKGVALHMNHPEAGPAASHAAWFMHRENEGWKYGPVEDPVNKTHPYMVHFDELPAHKRARYFIFRATVIEFLA